MLPVRSGLEAAPGSNAWVVSGSHTASGKPLFANDPHLDYSIPCIWYTVHLKSSGLNVIGVSLPATPGVIIGHNDRIAWGMTNLHYDVQDLYLSSNVESTEQERIHVRGQADFVLPVEFTRFGPVIAELGDRKAALRWTALDPGAWQLPILDLNRARNWNEFRRALARFAGPRRTLCMRTSTATSATRPAGKLPIRKGY